MTIKEALVQCYNIEHIGMQALDNDAYIAIITLLNHVSNSERPVEELRHWSRLVNLAADRIEGKSRANPHGGSAKTE